MSRYRKAISVLLIEVLALGIFLAPISAPATVVEMPGSERVVINLDGDNRNTTVIITPHTRCRFYVHMRDGNTSMTLGAYGGFSNSYYQAIFRDGNYAKLTSITLTATGAAADGCVLGTFGANTITSLTRYCAISMTSGTVTFVTDYFKILPSVSIGSN